MSNFIYLVNPLNGRGYDEAFADEVSAISLPVNDIATLDHDELTNHKNVSLKVPKFMEGEAVYRGWMLTPEQYKLFYQTALDKGIPLVTTPEIYKAAHQIDGWLDTFYDLTFPTVLIPLEDYSLEMLNSQLQKLDGNTFFIKDYVKSRKDDVSLSIARGRGSVLGVVQAFMEAQDDWLVGGIVIRQFVPLAEDRVEMRGWWREGKWRTVTVHPDYATHKPQPVPQNLLDIVSERLTRSGFKFVSADFTQTAEGNWVLIEIGDGQVSGFPQGITTREVSEILL